MKSRVDPRVVLVGCVGWSFVVWAVFGVLAGLYLLFGDPGQKQIGITATLVALLFIGSGVMSVADSGQPSLTSRVAGELFPSLRSHDGIPPGGLTFFGYMLVAGLQPLMLGVSLLA